MFCFQSFSLWQNIKLHINTSYLFQSVKFMKNRQNVFFYQKSHKNKTIFKIQQNPHVALLKINT